MKIGDAVRCHFQPRCGGWDERKKAFIKMRYTLKGEMGIITHAFADMRFTVLFPHLGYEHTLAFSTLEVVSESG